ncbi:MAG TPA: sugar phosphate nucleotidyltransferase [Vicinamibacterales bacterium]|nr:sugar phosphate nucleotidyltransferase [Vicinamibacterales bacterium]
MSERAVILAGGQGSRLRPFTLVLPKPLMPIGQYPILEIIVRQLAKSGVSRITIAVNHRAGLVQAFFGDGRAWGVDIDYSLEPGPLGTIGPLRLIPDLPERFLLMNGDVLTDLPYRDLFAHHASHGAPFTIAASRRTHTIDYGVLEHDDAGRLTGFFEKPTRDYMVSMGVYVMERSLIGRVPASGPYGFDQLMRDMLARGERVGVYPYAGYWLDIGRPDDYARAVEEFDPVKAGLVDRD